MGFMLLMEKRPPASIEFLDSPKDLGVKGWTVSPLNSHIQVATLSTSACDFIWKQGHCRCIELRSGHSEVGWAPNSIWRVSFQKTMPWEESDTHREAEHHGQMKAEIWGCIYKPGNGKDFQEATKKSRERPRTDSPSPLPERGLCNTLLLDF